MYGTFPEPSDPIAARNARPQVMTGRKGVQYETCEREDVMRTEVEKEQETRPSGKTQAWLAFLAVLLASAVFLLVGAQLAFLVRLPHLSALIRDPQAMWLVFSTWPEMKFGLFYCLVAAIYQTVSGLARKGLSPASAARRVRNMSRPAIIAAIGISVFLLPLILAVPFAFIDLATLLFCAAIGCLIFMWASRMGVPVPVLWTIAALSLGFFGNLLMSAAHEHRSFTCRTGTVQIRSGESLPCSNLVRLSGKPLWLVEGPQRPRLMLRTDIDDDQVDKALGL